MLVDVMVLAVQFNMPRASFRVKIHCCCGGLWDDALLVVDEDPRQASHGAENILTRPAPFGRASTFAGRCCPWQPFGRHSWHRLVFAPRIASPIFYFLRCRCAHLRSNRETGGSVRLLVLVVGVGAMVGKVGVVGLCSARGGNVGVDIYWHSVGPSSWTSLLAPQQPCFAGPSSSGFGHRISVSSYT